MKRNVLLPVAAALALAACTAADSESRRPNYRSANPETVQLEIPPDLRDPGQGDLYALPPGVTASPDALAQAPEGRVLTQVKNARIERAGNQRWLSVQGKQPAELWPVLRTFWLENGFTIAQEEPQSGLMETDWAENRAKLPHQGLRKLFDKVGLGSIYTTGQRDKFSVRMERNKQNGVDIFFTHKGLEEVYDGKNKDRTVWQPRAGEPDLEAAFLARLMQALGAEAPPAATPPAVQQPRQTAFARLEADAVFVNGSAERNVNRIGAALDRIGLTVRAFAHERGIFTVQPAPAESDVLRAAKQKQGWFDRLRGKKAPEAQIPQAPELFVFLEQSTGGQRVHLLEQSGQPYRGANKAQLLQQLYQELR